MPTDVLTSSVPNGSRTVSRMKKEVDDPRPIRRHEEISTPSNSLIDEDTSEKPLPVKRKRLDEDSTELFCASIASMLKTLQPFHRERIKRDIYNLVSDAVLSQLSHQ